MPVPPPIPQGGGGGAVDSVNGATGVVALDAADIPFTPGGTISATDVQGAIAEAASEAGGFAPASRYEAGGADPITNLQVPFAFPIGADDVVTITDVAGSVQVDINDIASDIKIRLFQDSIRLDNVGGFHASTLTSLGLQTTDSAGTSRVSFDWDFGIYTFKDPTGQARVEVKDDATGLTLYDTDGFARVLIPDDTALGVQLKDPTGTLTAQLADGVMNVFAAGATGAVTAHSLLLATDGVTADETISLTNITGGAGVLLRTADDGAGDERNMLYIYDMANSPQFVFAWRSVGGGGPLSAVFGATPYGQDAYLAPLNESVSITLLTDVAALLDEERARINAINAYLIARGWEAAA